MNSTSIHEVTLILDYNDPNISQTEITTIPLGPGNPHGPDYPSGSYVEIDFSKLYNQNGVNDLSYLITFDDFTGYFLKGVTLHVQPDFQQQRSLLQEKHSKHEENNAVNDEYAQIIKRRVREGTLDNIISDIREMVDSLNKPIRKIPIKFWQELDLFEVDISQLGSVPNQIIDIDLSNTGKTYYKDTIIHMDPDIVDFGNQSFSRNIGNNKFMIKFDPHGDDLPAGFSITTSDEIRNELIRMKAVREEEMKVRENKRADKALVYNSLINDLNMLSHKPHMSDILSLLVKYPTIRSEIVEYLVSRY